MDKSNVFKDLVKVLDYKFASQRKLDEHWDKHGYEVPQKTKQEYSDYVDRESDKRIDGTTVIGYRRPNGDIVKFNRSTGWMFVISGNNARTGIPFRGGESRYKRKKEEEKGKEINK